MTDFFTLLGAFLIGTVFAGTIRNFCTKRGMINEVNDRSSHATPTARGGGLAIVLLTLAFAAIWLYVTPEAGAPFIYALLGSSAVVATVGWLDDIKPRPALFRLVPQMACVALCLYFLPHTFTFMPLAVEKVLLFFAWVWFLNLYNFMDGVDGIAGMEATFLAVALSFFAPENLKPILLVLAGTSLGFLRVNFARKHKIFMGDVCSTFLGFILAGLMFHLMTWETLWAFLTISLVFTGDATYTLIKRTLQGKKPWQAHREHWYQRSAQAGLSHMQISARAAGINIVLLIIALMCLMFGLGPLSVVLGLCVLGFVAYRIRYLEGA